MAHILTMSKKAEKWHLVVRLNERVHIHILFVCLCWIAIVYRETTFGVDVGMGI